MQQTKQAIAEDKVTVFNWLLQRPIHEYIDVEGRPIGESRSQAYAQMDTQMKACPYAGSRYHHALPMNVSALNSILPEWQNILSLLSWLSQRYRVFHNTEVSSFYDLALVSGTGIFLADYMVLRRSQPLLTEQVPIAISGLYKVCLGFQEATFLAMMNDLFKCNDTQEALPDTKTFYAYLEDKQLLIGETEVCGGSEVMIGQAYEAMNGHHSNPETLDHLPQLTALGIDWHAYDLFTFHASDLWRQVILFAIQMRGFSIELQEPSVPDDLTQSVNAYLNSSFAELIRGQSGLAVEVAQFTLEDSDRTLDEWLTIPKEFIYEIDSVAAPNDLGSELSGAIIQHLNQLFDLSHYQSIVADAVKVQVAKYERFEAVALQAFNNHLESIVLALGFEHTDNEITPADLSAVYGQTLRDWPRMMMTNGNII